MILVIMTELMSYLNDLLSPRHMVRRHTHRRPNITSQAGIGIKPFHRSLVAREFEFVSHQSRLDPVDQITPSIGVHIRIRQNLECAPQSINRSDAAVGSRILA